MGLPIKGELGYGDNTGLGFAVVANWVPGTAQTLFLSPSDIGAAVLTLLVARSPTGTQPVSFTVRINGQMWGTAISLAGLAPGLVLPIITPSSLQAAAAPAQAITVTPLTPAAGTCTFDMQGYYYP